MSKRWSQEAREEISKITEEFNKKINESEENINLDKKVNELYSVAESKYQENCKEKIQDLLNYGKGEGADFIPFLESESRAEKSALILDQCRKPYMDVIKNFGFISQYTKQMFQMQTDFCYDDCDQIEKDPEKLKICIKNCCVNSIKYSLKSLTRLLSDTAESFTEEMKKL